MIYANTFQANGHKLEGTGYTPAQVVTRALKWPGTPPPGQTPWWPSTAAPSAPCWSPLGTLRFDDAYNLYREMVAAAQAAGADLIVFETFTDLYDMKAAVLAAKEHTSLPILCTMSFEENRAPLPAAPSPLWPSRWRDWGWTPWALTAPGPVELSLWPRSWSMDLPARGSEAQCRAARPATNQYTITPAEFARQLVPFTQLGVRILGGCCGTSPEFIQALRKSWAVCRR